MVKRSRLSVSNGGRKRQRLVFMSNAEYQKKQMELAEKIQKLKERYDFSWDSMGMIDAASEAEGKRLSAESQKLEEQARAWKRGHPDWC